MSKVRRNKRRNDFIKLVNSGISLEEARRRLQIPSSTFYRWKAKFETLTIQPEPEDKDLEHKNYISLDKKLELILELECEKTIQAKLDCGYSYLMVSEWLRRAHPTYRDNRILKECLESVASFRSALKVGGFIYHSELYLKKPQWWKMQYKYPAGWSVEEIKAACKESSRAGQRKTVEQRKQNGSYINQPFQREWSPLVLEFYTSRGWTKKEAQNRLNKMRTDGAHAALKVCQKPWTEREVSSLLEELGFPYTAQLRLPNIKGAAYDERKNFVYDFFIPEEKIIIEVNGDYWHCNPLIWESDQVVKFPSGHFKVQEVWDRDKRKIDFAREMGYTVLVIWETDLKSDVENCKRRILDEQIRIRRGGEC